MNGGVIQQFLVMLVRIFGAVTKVAVFADRGADTLVHVANVSAQHAEGWDRVTTKRVAAKVKRAEIESDMELAELKALMAKAKS